MAEALRIKGTETEFCVNTRRLQYSEECSRLTVLAGVDLNRRPRGDGHTELGSRYYLDVGHPEYSTGEQFTANGVVAEEMIGESFAINAFNRANEALENQKSIRYGPDPIFGVLSKKNTGDQETCGAHENYQVLREKFPDLNYSEIWQSLAAHLISRVIYTGSGGYIDGKYYLSPRSQWHVDTVNNNDTRQRPIVHTRDEPLISDTEKWRRLHVTTADANMSPWAIFMRISTTSLIIKAMEDGRRFDDLCPIDPITAGWQFGGSTNGRFQSNNDPVGSLSVSVPCHDGRRRNGLQIQREALDRVTNYVVTDEEQQAAEEWDHCLQILENVRQNILSADFLRRRDDASQFLRSIDWIHRLGIIEDKGEKAPPDKIDRLYDKLADDLGRGGIAQGRREHGAYRLTPDDWSLQAAGSIERPLRARLRGEAVGIMKQIDSDGRDTYVTWERVGRVGEPAILIPDHPTAVSAAYFRGQLHEFQKSYQKAA